MYDNEAKYRAVLVEGLARIFDQLEQEGEPEARGLFITDEQLARFRDLPIRNADETVAARCDISQRLRKIAKIVESQSEEYPGLPPASSTAGASTPTEVEMAEPASSPIRKIRGFKLLPPKDDEDDDADEDGEDELQEDNDDDIEADSSSKVKGKGRAP